MHFAKRDFNAPMPVRKNSGDCDEDDSCTAPSTSSLERNLFPRKFFFKCLNRWKSEGLSSGELAGCGKI